MQPCSPQWYRYSRVVEVLRSHGWEQVRPLHTTLRYFSRVLPGLPATTPLVLDLQAFDGPAHAPFAQLHLEQLHHIARHTGIDFDDFRGCAEEASR